MTKDPGWRLPSDVFVRALFLPNFGLAPKASPVLVAARALVLATLVHFSLLLALLWAIEVTPHGSMWFAVVLVTLGTANTQVARRMRARGSAGETIAELAATWRTSFQLGYGLALAVVLWGFVFSFLTGRIWMYLLGLPFGIAILAMIAPTTHKLERQQREIDRSGRNLSLAAALLLEGHDLPRTGFKRR